MKVLKIVVMLLVIASVIGVGIVMVAPSNPQAQLLVEKLHLAPLQPVASEALITANRIQTQIPQLGSVLGMKTEEFKNSPNASLPQKTAEFARYSYCQQVVKDYEERMGINLPKEPSPTPSVEKEK